MEFLRENPHAEWARQVFEMAHIEYGRLDYGVRNGQPQAWEINFTPALTGAHGHSNPEPETPDAPAVVRAAKEYSHAALREGFLRVDPGPISGGDLAAEFPAYLEEAARRERAEIERLARRQQWIARGCGARRSRRLPASPTVRDPKSPLASRDVGFWLGFRIEFSPPIAGRGILACRQGRRTRSRRSPNQTGVAQHEVSLGG